MAKKVKDPPPVVSVVKSTAPKTDPVPPGTQWVEVTIKLSTEQKEQLKKQGIRTTKIRIKTFDTHRLGGVHPLVEN
jgi:hypothetical protein